uniref:Uncharacterized protein n=1 Tax=Oryza rufipogon TaxID=4529 RepID=A0A0E0QXG8_ORYRU
MTGEGSGRPSREANSLSCPAATRGEALGRQGPTLPPRPGARGGGQPLGLTARWRRRAAAQPEPDAWRRGCHGKVAQDQDVYGIMDLMGRLMGGAWEEVRRSPQTQPPVTPTLDEDGRWCHLSPATKWAADRCGLWMQARTLKSIVESRPPKSGRAARQEQRSLLHALDSGWWAVHLHQHIIRPGGRPPPRAPGRGGLAPLWDHSSGAGASPLAAGPTAWRFSGRGGGRTRAR